MAWDRRGGHATDPRGERLVWSLAEGARGTRWRESVSIDGALIRSLLLEVTPAGAVARLEISTVEGMLTLHPEPDASAIHGNVVTPRGIRHLAFEWSPSHELFVAGSPATDAVAFRRLSTTVAIDGAAIVDALAIDDRLQPRVEGWRIERPAADRWRLGPSDRTGTAREVGVGPDGLPVRVGSESWLLEP
jgi:hypothetical protein